jgi:hypothetical protein
MGMPAGFSSDAYLLSDLQRFYRSYARPAAAAITVD